ncbi:class I adenylate-forming enzyme family protein [Stutzerimonas stutzeri]|uniref:class I adenylate-forming enzyme family protein n=1 Tax=Stutzerimonas stutzeri TaxID=316 RepID=UPI00210E5A9F|nr:AMP-binding protein [Stutzerimonas stutzeri]MCQ4323025.1 AMP-binding protein [Stutzerimonas stutzeri]
MLDSQIDRSLAAQAASLTVGGLFRFQAQYYGDRIALQDTERAYTYREVNERVNRLANLLSSLGVKHGDRVAVLSENRVEYIELQLAAAKIGVIVAAQNWRLAGGELEHCIRLSEPRVVIASPRYQELLDSVPHQAESVLCYGSEYEAALADAAATEPEDVAEPEDGLIILYTSGTTGLPKGALISHRAMIARGQIFYIDQGIERDDAFVAWAPLFHMVSTDLSLSGLMRGSKIIVLDGFDPDTLVKVVGKERIGWLVLMPGMIEPLNQRMRETGTRPAGVKAAGCMADLVPLHQIAEATELLRAPYVNSFGSSETGGAPASKALIPVGEVPQSLSKAQSSYCEIKLVDEDDHEVPDGEPGELAIRGPSLFSGYWRAPEVNAEAFRGGWFHMGDVFVRNPDGTLDFVDRRKYLIKSGGENIYPAEIERVLLADARIDDTVVVRKPDDRWGEVPVAFVVCKDPGLTEADVVACCEGKIARYKLPKEVHFVSQEDLPRSTTGKIKRHELEAQLKQPLDTESPCGGKR